MTSLLRLNKPTKAFQQSFRKTTINQSSRHETFMSMNQAAQRHFCSVSLWKLLSNTARNWYELIIFLFPNEPNMLTQAKRVERSLTKANASHNVSIKVFTSVRNPWSLCDEQFLPRFASQTTPYQTKSVSLNFPLACLIIPKRKPDACSDRCVQVNVLDTNLNARQLEFGCTEAFSSPFAWFSLARILRGDVNTCWSSGEENRRGCKARSLEFRSTQVRTIRSAITRCLCLTAGKLC